MEHLPVRSVRQSQRLQTVLEINGEIVDCDSQQVQEKLAELIQELPFLSDAKKVQKGIADSTCTRRPLAADQGICLRHTVKAVVVRIIERQAKKKK